MEYNYQLLKKARLEKGISVEQLAFDLCLSRSQIESIENNLPDFFYSQEIKLTCIKKYALSLGLDLEGVLNHSQKSTSETNQDLTQIHLPKPSPLSSPLNLAKMDERPSLAQNHSRHKRVRNYSNHDIVKKATQYIDEHLPNKITLQHLTAVTNYSERSIQLIFQKHFQQTPFEYIEEQRLLKAKALIESHGQSKKLAAIAHDVGLSHIGRFSVRFKKRFGLSPSILAKG